jgi:hypothetical protein
MKEGNLLVLFILHVEISQTKTLFCCALGIVGKLLMSTGTPRWFHNVLKYGGEVIE